MVNIIEKIKDDPYAAFLGIQIEKIQKGYALCSVTITKEMFNFMGVVHGGLVFSLADVAFSAAANCDFLPSYALDVSGSFLKTATAGEVIKAEARLVHTTKRTGLYRMEIMKGEELIATFNGTVFRKVARP
ncbi:MAG: PaaI family thioesterase [Smithellaceae bacterium]|nr:PaaI family thioesterase [Smithellaceae bacterium]